jgi:NADH-quinone oxidoreductase subunit N
MNAIIFSAVWGVVMMFSGLFAKNKQTITFMAIAGLLLLTGANLLHACGTWVINIDTHETLQFDSMGLFFNTVAFFSALLYVILSGKDIERTGVHVAEYYALIFFVLCGVSILTSFNGLLMLFLGVEIMTIPLYILTGADKRNLKSNEASLKYFLMGSFSTGIMLMGIALIYGATGRFGLSIGTVSTSTTGLGMRPSFLEIGGLILLFVAMCFKVSAAPFHFWTPDVYDGAPSVFTSFMATIVKSAGFFAFIKLMEPRTAILGDTWSIILPLVIVATFLVGNITAVFQQSVKRMLAYSSIAQAGFMLFALYGTSDMSKEGLVLYAFSYSIATIGLFAVLIRLKDYSLDGFNGLAAQHPMIAFSAAVFLLSLAGIPLTAGFFAKYYMLSAAVKAGGIFWLVILAVLLAAVSVYYYFRVIQSMYFKSGQPEWASPLSRSFAWTLLALAALLLYTGLFPTDVLKFIYF